MDIRLNEIFHAAHSSLAAGGNPQGEDPAGIDRAAGARDQPLAFEFGDVFGIGRGENIEGRRVLDLARQLRRRGEAEHRMDAGLGLELTSDFREDLGQVGRGADGNGRPGLVLMARDQNPGDDERGAAS